MASLTKDAHNPPKTPYWIACYNGRTSDGRLRRLKRSTKTRDRKLAQKIAEEYEAAEKRASEGRLTEAYVRKVLAEIHDRINPDEAIHFRTCKTWLAEWLASRKPEVDPATFKRYSSVIDAFVDLIGNRANLPVDEITPSDVRKYRDAMIAAGRANKTVNVMFNMLRTPFKAAHDAGYIKVNPCATIRAMKKENTGGKDVFTPEQIAALLKAAPSSDWQGMILCGWLTGLRLRDCSGLQWSEVDLEKRTITKRTQKTGRTVTIPLHPRFEAWLRKQTRGIGKAPVFRSLAHVLGGNLSITFGKIVKSAGIVGRLMRDGNNGGNKVSSLTFHSLRHTFNSAMANAGVSMELRQRLTGHASASMNTIYTHHDDAVLRAAVIKIGAKL